MRREERTDLYLANNNADDDEVIIEGDGDESRKRQEAPSSSSVIMTKEKTSQKQQSPQQNKLTDDKRVDNDYSDHHLEQQQQQTILVPISVACDETKNLDGTCSRIKVDCISWALLEQVEEVEDEEALLAEVGKPVETFGELRICGGGRLFSKTVHAASTLAHAIRELEESLPANRKALLVCCGPNALRQHLHPAAVQSKVELSNKPLLCQYVDLNKEFSRRYPTSLNAANSVALQTTIPTGSRFSTAEISANTNQQQQQQQQQQNVMLENSHLIVNHDGSFFPASNNHHHQDQDRNNHLGASNEQQQLYFCYCCPPTSDPQFYFAPALGQSSSLPVSPEQLNCLANNVEYQDQVAKPVAVGCEDPHGHQQQQQQQGEAANGVTPCQLDSSSSEVSHPAAAPVACDKQPLLIINDVASNNNNNNNNNQLPQQQPQTQIQTSLLPSDEDASSSAIAAAAAAAAEIQQHQKRQLKHGNVGAVISNYPATGENQTCCLIQTSSQHLADRQLEEMLKFLNIESQEHQNGRQGDSGQPLCASCLSTRPISPKISNEKDADGNLKPIEQNNEMPATNIIHEPHEHQQQQELRETNCLECVSLRNCKQVKTMAKLIRIMLKDGHQFTRTEQIKRRVEVGLCESSGIRDNEHRVVRARGLPWQATEQDIANFFAGLNIAKGGVGLCLSRQGRRNGEALIQFESREQRNLALARHKHYMGARYIEVYRASGEDFLGVAAAYNNKAQAFLSRGPQVIVRMRGLPFTCTSQQVLDFFAAKHVNNLQHANGQSATSLAAATGASGNNIPIVGGGANKLRANPTSGAPCEVLGGEEGILFVRNQDDKPNGDAFVLFGSEEMAQRALAKHRQNIGSRYVELFRSTISEVQQVLSISMDVNVVSQRSSGSLFYNAASNQADFASLSSRNTLLHGQQISSSPGEPPMDGTRQRGAWRQSPITYAQVATSNYNHHNHQQQQQQPHRTRAEAEPEEADKLTSGTASQRADQLEKAEEIARESNEAIAIDGGVSAHAASPSTTSSDTGCPYDGSASQVSEGPISGAPTNSSCSNRAHNQNVDQLLSSSSSAESPVSTLSAASSSSSYKSSQYSNARNANSASLVANQSQAGPASQYHYYQSSNRYHHQHHNHNHNSHYNHHHNNNHPNNQQQQSVGYRNRSRVHHSQNYQHQHHNHNQNHPHPNQQQQHHINQQHQPAILLPGGQHHHPMYQQHYMYTPPSLNHPHQVPLGAYHPAAYMSGPARAQAAAQYQQAMVAMAQMSPYTWTMAAHHQQTGAAYPTGAPAAYPPVDTSGGFFPMPAAAALKEAPQTSVTSSDSYSTAAPTAPSSSAANPQSLSSTSNIQEPPSSQTGSGAEQGSSPPTGSQGTVSSPTSATSSAVASSTNQQQKLVTAATAAAAANLVPAAAYYPAIQFYYYPPQQMMAAPYH